MQEPDLLIIGSGTAASRYRDALPRGGPERGGLAPAAPWRHLPAARPRSREDAAPRGRGTELVDEVRHLEGKGIVCRDLGIDRPALMVFERGFTDLVPPAREKRFEEAGITIFFGSARFLDPERAGSGSGSGIARSRRRASPAACRSRKPFCRSPAAGSWSRTTCRVASSSWVAAASPSGSRAWPPGQARR